MEGLEIAETKLSNITNVIDYRIEAEYFSSKFLLNDKKLATIKTHPFMEVATFINGRPYPSESFNYYATGVRIAKIGDVTNKRDIDSWEFVDIDEFHYQNGQLLTSGDILMTLTGDPPDIGKVNYMDDPINASWNQRVAKVRLIPEQKDYIGNDVLYIILSTEIVRIQLERYAKGIRQRNLGNESLDRLLLPDLSYELQLSIQNCVKQIYLNYNHSKCLYTEATNILLDNLKIKNCNLADSSPSIKSVQDSFVTSGRLDAEYYQPKYDDLFSRLNKFETKRLGDIVQIRKSIEPGSEAYQNKGIPFMRVSNLSKFGFSDTEIHLSPDEYKDIIRPKQNTILLSKDGSVGIAYKVEQDMYVITSGAILHLTIKDNEFMPDYLTLVLNSVIVGMQADRDAGGSIIQHWKPSEIENVIIPKLSQEIQQEITNKVRESFALRRESKRLLNLAKTAVETAIEQGESAAMELLN